jgi:hypothetical protein
MNLGQFKSYLQALPQGTTFAYSIDNVFSYRGYCYEVAFSLSASPSTKEQLLTMVERALTEAFPGHHAGEYEFDEHTLLHFEHDPESGTKGRYTQHWIEVIDNDPDPLTTKLIKRAFSAN